MQRLYVGGLSHTVTKKDLKDRFGKFGEVQDVELRTRRDEEGIPHKTFGYINIDISEAELKRCMTVLNKSKWKGGTLQIEIAKESFLHRLTQERQEAMEQRLQPPATEDKRQKLLDSLSKAGVDNFTMKAAVPGTEVPGHKNWVVSKFGRVLPILQLRCKKGNRARTVKYDPSKYSHNIRKLGPVTVDQSTPVTQLTWEVQGGDDDISKKRRGEFPPYEPPGRKKSRTDKFNSRNDTNRSRLEKTLQSDNTAKTQHVTNGFEKPANSKPVQRKSAALLDSDDSDEEIRRLMAAHNTSSSAPSQVVEEDNLEVVGLDYLVKSGRSGQQQKGGPTDEEEDDYDSADTDELFASRRPPPASAAHMQEKQTVPKANHLSGNNTDRKRKTKKKSKSGSKEEGEDDDSADAEEHITSRKPSTAQQRWDYGKQTSEKQGSSSGNQSKKMVDLSDVKSDFSESDSDEDDENEGDKELESSASCSDSEYEAMFSNVTCLEISFTDLQRLAEESQPTPETTIPSILGVDPEKETSLISEHTGPKRGTTPEEILASIMEDESTDDEKRTKKRKSKCVASTLLPAFQGTKTLNEKLESSDQPNRQNKGEENGGVVKKQKLDFETPQRKTESTSGSSEQDEEEHEGKIEVVKNIAAVKVFEKVPNNVPVNAKKLVHSSSSGSDDDDDDEEEKEEEEKKEERKNANQTLISAKVGAEASPSSSSTSHKEDEDVGKTATPPASHSNSSSSDGGESSSSSEEEEEEEASHPSRVTLRAEEEEEQQRKANMRRLAAIQQKLKEAEEHKRLIQGALANLDTPTQGAGKHIVFGSDDEEEEEDDGEDKDQQQTPSEITVSKKTLFQDDQSEEEAMSEEASATDNTLDKKLSGSQLFGGSEDEEESDEEEDGNRFEIRPQFEGRAGQKLMELQSRFGTDERFRMDSRFLEEDDKEEESETQVCMTEVDQALEEERKKNLSILQSILGGSQQTYSTKTSSKAKTFRDVSALHYDPSKEEHAAFETKPEESKESKSARRRKREEALKLPEVSKEIYYDVSGDLKAVFGPTQDDGTEGQKSTSWDQEEEEVKGGEGEAAVLSSLVSADPVVEKEESGFKFSFFGDDAETVNEETMEYKVESIQAPKVSWQQDLRFQDSSSEEDEDEDGQEEDEEQSRATPKTAEEVTPSKTTLFFFYHEDCRLAEGPRLFCRSSQLEEQRDQWEERRSELRQEYRKKHKDARRKLKSSMKT